jgi:hypothetical protein
VVTTRRSPEDYEYGGWESNPHVLSDTGT